MDKLVLYYTIIFTMLTLILSLITVKIVELIKFKIKESRKEYLEIIRNKRRLAKRKEEIRKAHIQLCRDCFSK